MYPKRRNNRAAAAGMTLRATLGLGAAVGILVVGAIVAVRLGAESRLPELPPRGETPAAAMETLERFDEAARADASSAEAVGALGTAYHACGFPNPARACYALAEELAPEDAHWPYHRALLEEEFGRFDDMLAALERVVELDPDHALAWLRLGEAHWKRADYAGAAAAYRRARDLSKGSPPGESLWERRFPLSAHAAYGLARVAAQRGDREKELDWLHTAIGEAPFFGDAHRLLATVLDRQDRMEEAEARRAIADDCPGLVPPRDPCVDRLAAVAGNSEFLIRYANFLIDVGDGESAREYLLRAERAAPADADTVVAVTKGFLRLGLPAEALPVLLDHRQRVPDDAQVEATLRDCVGVLVNRYRAGFRLGEAEKAVRGAISSSPRDEWLHGILGEILFLTHRPREAVPELRRSLATEEDAGVRTLLASSLTFSGDPEAGVEEIERTRAEHPDYIPALRNAVLIYRAAGRDADATAAAEQLVAAEPNDPRARVLYAELLEGAGRKEEAAKQCRKALELDPRNEEARKLLEATGR